jgi:hypothetical protein
MSLRTADYNFRPSWLDKSLNVCCLTKFSDGGSERAGSELNGLHVNLAAGFWGIIANHLTI